MKTLRRLLCRLFGHTPPAGLRPDLCIRFWCDRCRQVVPGPFALNRSTRRT